MTLLALTIFPQNGWCDINIVKTWGRLSLSFAYCTGYFSHHCDHIPAKKQLRWGRFYFGLQFEGLQEWGCGRVWSGWSPVTAARKQSSNGKLDQAIKTEDAPSVSHFLQQCSISLRVYSIPKLCHIPETMCSSTWAYMGYFAFKPWQVTAVFSILGTEHLYFMCFAGEQHHALLWSMTYKEKGQVLSLHLSVLAVFHNGVCVTGLVLLGTFWEVFSSLGYISESLWPHLSL